MAKSIPPKLTANHIKEAMRQLDTGLEHRFGTATKYQLDFEGRAYAPKAVVGIAIEILEHRKLGPSDLRSGIGTGQAVNVLREMGFTVSRIPRKPGSGALTFLFSWNPAKWSWEKFSKLQKEWLAHSNTEEEWSSGTNKSIPAGARIFLLKQGEPPKGIVGSGRTTSGPQRGPHWDGSGRQRNFNDIRFDFLLDPRVDGLLPVEELQDLSTTLWSSPSSGIKLPPKIAAEVELRWGNFLTSIGRLKTAPFEVPESLDVPDSEEGMRLLAWHFTIERDPLLVKRKKKAVIKETGGLACEVCDFDFFETYGDHGQGFCECHHTRPLSEGKRTTGLDDLAVICANCHRMVHRRKLMLTLAQLRKIVKREQG
jgi:5-methylcytosine-specific restriction protein A